MKIKILILLLFISLSDAFAQQYKAPINLNRKPLNVTSVDILKGVFISKGLDRQSDITIEDIGPEDNFFLESTLIVGDSATEVDINSNQVDLHRETSEEVINRIDAESEGLRVSTYSNGFNGEEGTVRFSFDSYNLTTGTRDFLDYFSTLILETSPEIILVINGHTDDTGEDAYNMNLSTKRAESVMKYLVSKGLNGENITIVGKGETTPKFPNNSDLNKGLNRRVEFEFYNEK